MNAPFQSSKSNLLNSDYALPIPFEELNKDYLKDIDVLVDGEFKDELKDNKAHWVGSINQRVIDIPLTLKENKVIVRRT